MGIVMLFKLPLCFLCALFSFVDGVPFASNTLVSTANAPIGYGEWRASASCSMSFNGLSYNAGEAYILVRFGVPFSNLNDNANGAIVDQAAKWYVVQNGYGGSNIFLFTVTYEYAVWLASDFPSGTCEMYMGSADALSAAYAGPDLTDTPADPLVSTVPFTLTALSSPNAWGLCAFSFPGITIGQFETMIIINITVPATNLADYNGGIIDVIADDNTWYKATNPQGLTGSFTYANHFQFSTSDENIMSAKCYLLVASSLPSIDSSWSLDMILNTAATTTTTTASAATTSSIVSPATLISTTGPTTIWPATAVNVTDRDILYEYPEMRDKFVEYGNIWQLPRTNIIRCGRRCRADVQCNSVFFEETLSRCTAHNAILSSGSNSSKVYYFIMM